MKGLEILGLESSGEYYRARVAVHGQLAIPFDFHKSVRFEQFPRDDDFEAFLYRQGVTLIESYGDAREQRLQ